MNKRGLSGVVTTLIIILLALVAVGIVWVVIQNLVSDNQESISLASQRVDLDIKSVKFNTNNELEVVVKRGSGQGDLTAVNIIISDGENTKVIRSNLTIGELEQKKIVITPSELGSIPIVKQVSIAPIFTSESGKEGVGSEMGAVKFNSEEAIKNINGLVAWWRFEGDAKDSAGSNDGNIVGGVDCNVAGKYGKACSFDGVLNSYVETSSNLVVDDTTIIAWFKINPTESGGAVFANIVGSGEGGQRMLKLHGTTSQLQGVTDATGAWSNHNVYGPVLAFDGTWNSAAFTVEGDSLKIYYNGVLENSATDSFNIIADGDVHIGGATTTTWYSLDGSIDEVMIFDRALTDEEIKAVYELDLS